MNERIRELAVEAEDYADGIVDAGGEFHLAYTQKLVELVVGECIDVVDVGGEIVSRPKMVERIKQHFGIDK